MMILSQRGFYAHGPTRTVAVLHGKAYLGVIHAPIAARTAIANEITDNRFGLLPGPNATVTAAQVAALAKVAPALTVKAGDPFKVVLSYVHALFGDAAFNAEAY